MAGDSSSSLPLFFLLAIFALSFLIRRGKNQAPPAIKPPVQPGAKKVLLKKQSLSTLPFKEERKLPIRYEVDRKKQGTFLSKKWKDKDSLKQAFILSEILKRVDERDF